MSITQLILSEIYGSRLLKSDWHHITKPMFFGCTIFHPEFRQSVHQPKRLGIGCLVLTRSEDSRVGDCAIRLNVKANHNPFVALISLGNLNIGIQPFFKFVVSAGKLAYRVKVNMNTTITYFLL